MPLMPVFVLCMFLCIAMNFFLYILIATQGQKFNCRYARKQMFIYYYLVLPFSFQWLFFIGNVLFSAQNFFQMKEHLFVLLHPVQT